MHSKAIMVAALALGVAGGSYGIASAASGNSSGGAAATTTTTVAAPPQGGHGGGPWGGQRSDETPLTGDALDKVTAAAKAKVPGGTIVRVETDADGHAKYEAHMTDANGNPVTVYVDEDYKVVSTETR